MKNVKFMTVGLDNTILTEKILLANGCVWDTEESKGPLHRGCYILVDEYGSMTSSASKEDFENSYYIRAGFTVDRTMVRLDLDIPLRTSKDNAILLQDLNAFVIKLDGKTFNFPLPRVKNCWHYNGWEANKDILHISMAAEYEDIIT